nr:uncharacterized protein LOC127317018 isoform X2 [Lolium perenne]
MPSPCRQRHDIKAATSSTQPQHPEMPPVALSSSEMRTCQRQAEAPWLHHQRSFQSYQVDNRELLHIVVRRQHAAGWLATIVWRAITSYGEAGDELCEAADMLRGGCQRSAGGGNNMLEAGQELL